MSTSSDAASSPAPISLRDVTKSFAGRGNMEAIDALGPITLDFRPGEFFSIVGPSGCGKSTLLEIVAGLANPSSGTVHVNGRATAGSVPEGLGVIFQEDASFPWLTVRENIAFGLKEIRLDSAEAERRIRHALSLMGLEKFAQAYPSQLSGGMRQRVCIARTLVLQPKIILLDEPFGALDEQTRLIMGDEVLRLWRETSATILLITHSLDEAALLSDRIGVMSARPGRFLEIVETGWPADRDSQLAADEKFGRLTSQLWQLLRSQALQAAQNSGL